jgi:hypothetical protein
MYQFDKNGLGYTSGYFSQTYQVTLHRSRITYLERERPALPTSTRSSCETSSPVSKWSRVGTSSPVSKGLRAETFGRPLSRSAWSETLPWWPSRWTSASLPVDDSRLSVWPAMEDRLPVPVPGSQPFWKMSVRLRGFESPPGWMWCYAFIYYNAVVCDLIRTVNVN